MKRIICRFVPVLVALIASFGIARGQYHMALDSVRRPSDTSGCGGEYLHISTDAYASGLFIRSYFGDGETGNTMVTPMGSTGRASVYHRPEFAGVYTSKHVLSNGTTRFDSIVETHEYFSCKTFLLNSFADLNGNGTYDAAEPYYHGKCEIEVSKAGVPLDTINMMGGTYYSVVGSLGDIYAFKVISMPSAVSVTTPASGIVYDTIQIASFSNTTKQFGVQCTGGSSPASLEVDGWVATGRHSYLLMADVWSNSCTPENATITMYCSSKYTDLYGRHPAPASLAGHTITWNLAGITALTPARVRAHWEQSPWLLVGDTVHSTFVIAPATSGIIVNPNDTIKFIDTVTSSFDPNAKEVSPRGYIDAGTKLTYTIHFENTGNDTAFNIHIMDTLSKYVDVKSLDVLMSSAQMNLHVLNIAGKNIVKFDFPNINLLDSSHHGLCDGFVKYSINVKPDLDRGTEINNRAGIYFDYNPVVLTNTVTNIIGGPVSVAEMSTVLLPDVYPNPVQDVLHTGFDGGHERQWEIRNVIGQVLVKGALEAGQSTIGVSSLANGIYILSVKGEGGARTQRFEKR